MPDDFGSEIDLVVGWANTGTELNDHIRGIGAEAFNHLSDRVCDDAKLGAFAAGMHKADRRCIWIDDVNRATVCDINAERDAALIGDDAIAAANSRPTGLRLQLSITAMLSPWICSAVNSGQFAKAGCVSNFAMCGIEPLEHFGFIVGDVDAGNSLRENVTTDFDRA